MFLNRILASVLAVSMILSFSGAGLSRNYPKLNIKDRVFNDVEWLSRSVSRSFDGGNFTYRIPEDFVSVEIPDSDKSDIFNVDDGDCNAYLLNGLTLDQSAEVLCVFYFDYVKYLRNESDVSEKREIAKAVINNITPGAFDWYNVLFFINISKENVDGRDYYHFVAMHGDHRVEYAFTEVEGGMCVLMYIYNDGHNYVDDIRYVLHSISEKGE